MKPLRQTELIQCDVHHIHETLQHLCKQLNVDAPRPLISGTVTEQPTESGHAGHSDTDREADNVCELSPPTSPSAVQAPIDTFLDIAKLGSPTSADTPHSFRQRRPAPQHDLVSKGIIAFSTAEVLVDRYFSRLDHFLYGIASHHKDIHGLRQASPVLFAAVCTISALHASGDQLVYDKCSREFRRLVSRSLFEKKDVEYLRALCVGSFWLADASRILSSDALRRAADVRLHRNFYQVVNFNTNTVALDQSALPQVEGRDRMRLWYLLFVCDQHLSILHNRDGVLRQDNEILQKWELYLNSDGCNDSDIRIMSQVSLLLIMSEVRDALGSERLEQLPKSLVVQLNHFSKQLDEWFTKFSAIFRPNPQIGDFPSKGLQMHYQFGKMYLGQHVFRGLKTDPVPLHFLPAAGMAHEAAITIFRMILHDERLQESLIGIPHYFHIMIAFAGHFILEVCKKYSEQLMINLDENLRLIAEVLAQFNKLPSISPHPICRMTAGLSRKLVDCAIHLGKCSCLEGNFIEPANRMPFQSSLAIDPELQNHMVQASNLDSTSAYGFPSDQLPASVDEYSYTDFGEFNFPDMRLNFLT
ncbi:hypothetical protein UCRPC4_g02565 [Phaeomoniella chlamydospora]|uniref:Transcription factor domain-containing protein n=1 Tax=Phaeomoniella chlamydospora TaxID=158046 RepID=A0A0G2EP60_PHACM|nr:hypothetical protein UCRPC4_g02565 [Phaeomoniella chlamydospora]